METLATRVTRPRHQNGLCDLSHVPHRRNSRQRRAKSKPYLGNWKNTIISIDHGGPRTTKQRTTSTLYPAKYNLSIGRAFSRFNPDMHFMSGRTARLKPGARKPSLACRPHCPIPRWQPPSTTQGRRSSRTDGGVRGCRKGSRRRA